MEVYRISHRRYIKDLHGEGAKLNGGRWNRPGIPVLYTSQARSLAMLELIVHLNAKSVLSKIYDMAVIEIREEEIVTVPILNDINIFKKFRSEEIHDITEQIFYEENKYVLKVPSVLVAGEYNYLINPLHKCHINTRINYIEAVHWDERLVQFFK